MSRATTILAICAVLAVPDLRPVSASPREGSRSSIDIFQRVEQANAARDGRLRAYSSMRRYSVWEPGHDVDAALVVLMEFVAPSTKTFKTVSETGVGWIQRRVFRRLIDAERDAAAGQERRNSALSLANYDVQLVGEDQYQGRDCYVVELSPKRRDKYLLKGKAWIDKEDLAIAKLEAEPAVSPSFWVTRAPFVREYQRINGSWLPLRDLTHCQIRFVGEYILQVDYTDYHVTVQD